MHVRRLRGETPPLLPMRWHRVPSVPAVPDPHCCNRVPEVDSGRRHACDPSEAQCCRLREPDHQPVHVCDTSLRNVLMSAFQPRFNISYAPSLPDELAVVGLNPGKCRLEHARTLRMVQLWE